MKNFKELLTHEKIQKEVKKDLVEHLIVINTVAKRYAYLTDNLKEKSEYIFLDYLKEIYTQIIGRLNVNELISLFEKKFTRINGKSKI